jgi:alkanesulfonate monooxygenase SsuD/methylene tetrahydromethanopterin reductase-like flavin-dependent oxidoreductase (luciferase family)
MDFHLFLPQMRFSMQDLVARAQCAEAAGFGGLALMDHMAPPMAEQHAMFDAMTTATWLAARTDRLTLGHLVLCDAMRHPAVLAKEVVTLDHASGGRFELGIGSGSVPEELDTFGVFRGSTGDRIARLRETLEVLSGLWSGESFSFDGEFHQLHDARQQPVPSRHVPIVIGGVGPKMLQLVERFADWWNVPLHELSRLDRLRPLVGSAAVSVQQMIAFVPAESERAAIAAKASARFAVYGDGLVIGNAAELVDHFGALTERGIERVYTWFADFASTETLAAFGADVIAPLRS